MQPLHTGPLQKTIICLLMTAALTLLLPGCSSWRQVTVRISEQELLDRINERFPVTGSYPVIGTVTFTNPYVCLRRPDNRVRLGMDITLGDDAGGSIAQGRLELTAVPVYESAKKALYLTEPHVEHFSLMGLPEHNEQLLRQLSVPLLERLLRRNPVYRVRPEGIHNLAALLLRDMRVSKGRLEIVFGV